MKTSSLFECRLEEMNNRWFQDENRHLDASEERRMRVTPWCFRSTENDEDILLPNYLLSLSLSVSLIFSSVTLLLARQPTRAKEGEESQSSLRVSSNWLSTTCLWLVTLRVYEIESLIFRLPIVLDKRSSKTGTRVTVRSRLARKKRLSSHRHGSKIEIHRQFDARSLILILSLAFREHCISFSLSLSLSLSPSEHSNLLRISCP